MQRRTFCKFTLLALPASMATGCAPQTATEYGINAILSGCDDEAGQHYIAQLGPAGNFLARVAVPQRVHGSVYVPQLHSALFFARRPGNHLYQLDMNTGQLVHTLVNTPDRHFYGHGVVTADGATLFTTENNTRELTGVIGVYSLGEKVEKIGEFPSAGIGPHQLALMPDQQTLVVANGGMATHPDSEREVLNLDTMAPNLTYLNIADGSVLESHEPPHHKMSIRHLDVSPDGTVVFGVQHQGDLTDQVSLIGSHRQGQALRWLEMPDAMQLRIQQYTASVAVDAAGDYVAVSCPRGNLVGCWEVASGRLVQLLDSPDAAGLHRVGGTGWVSSNGYGDVSVLRRDQSSLIPRPISHSPYRWDNHLTVI